MSIYLSPLFIISLPPPISLSFLPSSPTLLLVSSLLDLFPSFHSFHLLSSFFYISPLLFLPLRILIFPLLFSLPFPTDTAHTFSLISFIISLPFCTILVNYFGFLHFKIKLFTLQLAFAPLSLRCGNLGCFCIAHLHGALFWTVVCFSPLRNIFSLCNPI